VITIDALVVVVFSLVSSLSYGVPENPAPVENQHHKNGKQSDEGKDQCKIAMSSMEKAEDLLSKSKPDASSALLEKALKQCPNDRDARLLLGHAYLAQKKYQHALNAFSFILLNNRKDSQACSGRALALVGLADVPKATIWAKKATEISPDDLHAWDVLGQVYLTENYLDAPRAEAAYRQMLVLEPKSTRARLMLAKALSYQKKVTDAISLLEQLVKESPDDVEASMKLAESYYATRKLTKADAMLKKILAKDKKNSKALALLHAIDSQRTYQFWIPVGVGILVPLLYFFIRRLRRGRIVQE